MLRIIQNRILVLIFLISIYHNRHFQSKLVNSEVQNENEGVSITDCNLLFDGSTRAQLFQEDMRGAYLIEPFRQQLENPFLAPKIPPSNPKSYMTVSLRINEYRRQDQVREGEII
jgi:hypothetical protein